MASAPVVADGLQDFLLVQVAVVGRRTTQRVGLVSLANVQRVGVGLRVDGHRTDAHLAAGAHDPAGDFAPVGYENLC